MLPAVPKTRTFGFSGATISTKPNWVAKKIFPTPDPTKAMAKIIIAIFFFFHFRNHFLN
jgi:hypothetical protein